MQRLTKSQMTKETSGNINKQLKQLESIVSWFENQEEVDIEAGLKKVKEGATLIKELKTKMKIVENEFKEIKKDLE